VSEGGEKALAKEEEFLDEFQNFFVVTFRIRIFFSKVSKLAETMEMKILKFQI
jgi:hypothetical protein